MKCKTWMSTWLAAALASSGSYSGGHDRSGGGRWLGGVGTAPAQLLRASLSAAQGEAGVDWVGTTHTSNVVVTLTTKAGRHDGVQSINFHIGAKDGQISIILVGTTVYILGNSFGLQQYMGFSDGGAKGSRPLGFDRGARRHVGDHLRGRRGRPYRRPPRCGNWPWPGLSQRQRARRWRANSYRHPGVRHLVNSQAPATPQVLYLKSTGRAPSRRSRAEL